MALKKAVNSKPNEWDELETLRERVEHLAHDLAEEIEEHEETKAALAKASGGASEGQLAEKLTTFLTELPPDSRLVKSVRAFFDSLVENYHDGPGAPGRAAYEILCAMADPTDTAYSSVTVTQRAMCCNAANSFKGAFKK